MEPLNTRQNYYYLLSFVVLLLWKCNGSISADELFYLHPRKSRREPTTNDTEALKCYNCKLVLTHANATNEDSCFCNKPHLLDNATSRNITRQLLETCIVSMPQKKYPPFWFCVTLFAKYMTDHPVDAYRGKPFVVRDMRQVTHLRSAKGDICHHPDSGLLFEAEGDSQPIATVLQHCHCATDFCNSHKYTSSGTVDNGALSLFICSSYALLYI